MLQRDQAWLRHQQTRWMKADAGRWVRPAAARFLKPGVRPRDAFPALDRKYSASQPRVPAGNSRGGQWTSGNSGGGGGSVGAPGGIGFDGEGGGFGGDIGFDGEGIDFGGSLAFDDPGNAGGIALIFDGIDLSDGISLGDSDNNPSASEFDVAARGNEAQCEFQYKQDSNICRIVGTRACWAQAAERLGACLGGRPIPALRF